MEACHTPWLDSCDKREARAGGREEGRKGGKGGGGERGRGVEGGGERWREGRREEWFTKTCVGDYNRRVTKTRRMSVAGDVIGCPIIKGVLIIKVTLLKSVLVRGVPSL